MLPVEQPPTRDERVPARPVFVDEVNDFVYVFRTTAADRHGHLVERETLSVASASVAVVLRQYAPS